MSEITWETRLRNAPIEAVFLHTDGFQMGFRLRDQLARFVEVGACSPAEIFLPTGTMSRPQLEGFAHELLALAEQLHA